LVIYPLTIDMLWSMNISKKQ